MKDKEKDRSKKEAATESENKDTQKERESKKDTKRKGMNPWLSLLLKLAILATIVFACSFFVKVEFLHSNEMFPSLRDGDLVIATNILEYSFNDIILYEAERNGVVEKHFGRIMCLGDNEVELDDYGNVLVNGSILGVSNYYQEYEKGDITYPYTVGENEVFILQDYRPELNDSRTFGAIPMENILGKVVFCFRIRSF